LCEDVREEREEDDYFGRDVVQGEVDGPEDRCLLYVLYLVSEMFEFFFEILIKTFRNLSKFC
jgi:hypothetical protein